MPKRWRRAYWIILFYCGTSCVVAASESLTQSLPPRIELAPGGVPPGMTLEEARVMWAERAALALMQNPYPWVQEIVRMLNNRTVGILFGTEVDSGGRLASVRVHVFSESGPVPVIKIQTTVLNLPELLPQMDELLVHESAHLWEMVFLQRPPEVFNIEAMPSDWRVFHLVETELYAYWIEAEYCVLYDAGCKEHEPIQEYRQGGLSGMVDYLEKNFEFFSPWINEYCPASDQAFATFRARHVTPS